MATGILHKTLYYPHCYALSVHNKAELLRGILEVKGSALQKGVREGGCTRRN